MSTAPSPPPAPAKPHVKPGQEQLRIIRHSTLFYWWPVWAAGFIFGLISTFSGQRLAIVPDNTKAHFPEKDSQGNPKKTVEVTITTIEGQKESTDRSKGQTILVAPDDKPMPDPYFHISANKNLGIFYFALIIFVVLFTSIPLRGLWSIMVISTIIFLIIIFALLGFWDKILTAFGFLSIYVNQGGYFFFSTVLFIIWLVVFLLFDPQIYIILTPGQVRIREEIGEGEIIIDSAIVNAKKERSDFFRHWILGFGSGDLMLTTRNARHPQIDFPNVLFLGRKMKEIEDMLRRRPVVSGVS